MEHSWCQEVFVAKILLASLKAILNWLGGARCRRQEAISEPYWTALTLTLVFVTFGISLSASRMCLSSQLQARSKGTEPQWLQTERWPNASMIGKDDLKCCTNPWTTSRTKPQCRARCRRKIRRPLGRHLATSFYATKRGSLQNKTQKPRDLPNQVIHDTPCWLSQQKMPGAVSSSSMQKLVALKPLTLNHWTTFLFCDSNFAYSQWKQELNFGTGISQRWAESLNISRQVLFSSACERLFVNNKIWNLGPLKKHWRAAAVLFGVGIGCMHHEQKNTFSCVGCIFKRSAKGTCALGCRKTIRRIPLIICVLGDSFAALCDHYAFWMSCLILAQLCAGKLFQPCHLQ